MEQKEGKKNFVRPSERGKKEKKEKGKKGGKLRCWYPKPHLHIDFRISGPRPIFTSYFGFAFSSSFCIVAFFILQIFFSSSSPFTSHCLLISFPFSPCCKFQSLHLGQAVASCGSCRNTQPRTVSGRPSLRPLVLCPTSFMTHSRNWLGCVGRPGEGKKGDWRSHITFTPLQRIGAWA